MRHTFDMTPFTRSSIGFERLLEQLGSISQPETEDSYPPYNIEKAGEDRYRITLATPGFAREALEITAQPNLLIIAGRAAADGADRAYLHRGIAGVDFERRFELADHVVVKSADYVDGVLSIDLARQTPEAPKPHRVKIGRRPALAD